MGKQLIIAEKPSLAMMIKNALFYEKWNKNDGFFESENYIISYAFGHLFQLYDVDDYFNRDKTAWSLEELPFIPNKYKYKIKDDKGVKQQLNIIANQYKRKDVDCIVSAGDPDDEGCKIISDIEEYCRNNTKLNKPFKRLWFTEQNEETIRRDIKRLKDNSEYDIYSEKAKARAICDWLIGINQTRILSLLSSQNGNKTLLPNGRVLGCIVQFIYDRYKEQENFIPKKYFNIGMSLSDYELNLVLKDILFEEEEEYKAIALANELNRSKTLIKDIVSKNTKKQPLKLFSLTTLQNKLSKEYKFSSKETLALTQSLYEKWGAVTYPRAKSEYLPDNEKDKVKRVLEEFKKSYPNIEFRETPHIFDSSKVGSDHSAIIPTNKIPDINKLSQKEKIVYETIRNRFLSNFCTEECIVNEEKIIIGNDTNECIAEIKGIKVVQEGFLKYDNIIKEKTVPNLKKGQVLKADYGVNECYTKPPANVTTIELNNFLQSPFSKEDESEDEKYKKILSGLEIGTVATRAGIIENAKKYDYISENKGIFKITEKGIYFIETSEKLGLKLTTMETAKIGTYLQSVFDRKITVDQCVKIVENDIKEKIIKAKEIKIDGFIQEKEVIGNCPKCGKNILEGGKAFYCEGFKDKSCNFALFKKDKFLTSKGKSLTKGLASKLLKNSVVAIKGLKKKDGNGTYDANITIVKNGEYYNITFAENSEKTALAKCPKCGKEILEGNSNYYCIGYKDENKCNYKVWKTNKYLTDKKIKLNKNHIKKLIEGVAIKIKELNLTISLNDDGLFIFDFKK